MADISASASMDATISEESLMLDEMRRIGHSRSGCFVVYFHLSDLQAPFRKPLFIRIAARAFDSLINNHDATLYTLSNANLALICRDVQIDHIDTAIFKLRALFIDDPLAAETAEENFATWYDLSNSEDFAEFEKIATTLEAELQQRKGVVRRPGAEKRVPIDASALAQMERRLQTLQVSDLLCQQPTVDIRSGRGRQVLFVEHYVSMSGLAKQIAPDVDLFSNPWLFNFVTDFLDRRMLVIIGHMNFGEMEDAVSLNLHVGSVLSPEFQIFHNQISPHAKKVIVEFQMIDIIADMGAFDYAKKWLQDQGYRILIDGLYPLTLQYLDPGILEPDLIKIAWSPDLARDMRDSQVEELNDIVSYLGPDKVVLARVETQEAIRWGLNLGIHRFQGFFVDKLVDAMTAKGLI